MELNQVILDNIEDDIDCEEVRVPIKFNFIRKLPDPVFATVKHFIGFLKAEDYVTKFPDKPNPRPSDGNDLNKCVYKEVVNSFNNVECTPNTFHLKSHSCRITCADVIKIDDNGNHELVFKGKQGIADGLHCLNIMHKHKKDSPNQYISFWITIGIPDSFITEMSQGLNSNMQVALESLLNYDGKFDWIKDTLSDQVYCNEISYVETVKRNINVTFLVQLMTLFNIKKYSVNGDDSPTIAYSQKNACLKYYDDHIDEYKQLSKVLPDILTLYDTIQITGPEIYGKGSSNLSFVDNRKKPYEFYFTKQSRTKKLTLGAVFPLLASFRVLLEEDSDGFYKWKDDRTIDDIIKIWSIVAKKLLKSTKSNFEDLGRDANRLGKSSSHWKSIFMELQLLLQNNL